MTGKMQKWVMLLALFAMLESPALAVLPGVDWRTLPVDATGTALGTMSNPIATVSGSATTGVISTVNSSTTALLANGVFTGTGEDVSGYVSIEVSVFSDQASANNGIQFEFSSDNTHWDEIRTQQYQGGVVSTGTPFVLLTEARYFRIIYTNGGTNQGSFRLQTVYHSATLYGAIQVYDPTTGLTQSVRSANSLAANFLGGTQPALVLAGQSTNTPAFTFLSAPAVGTAVASTGNPLQIGGTDGTNARGLSVDSGGRVWARPSSSTGTALLPDGAALADATANPTLTEVQVFPSGFNGTTWDRLKTVPGATGTTGTGLLGAGILGFDGTNYTRLSAPAAGTAVASTGNPLQIAGTDGTNARGLKVNTDGTLAVGGFTTTIQVTVVTSANTYSNGQAIGALDTIASATRLSGGSAVIEDVSIVDKDKQDAAVDVIFFNASITAPTDHTTFAPSNTDLLKSIGHVAVNNYSAFSANAVATTPSAGIGFSLPSGTSLFAVVVSRGTPTYTTTSSLQLTVTLLQD